MRVNTFIIIVCIASLFLLLVNVYPSLFTRPEQAAASLQNTKMAKLLMLTDLAIWTESRYTRHPSQADLFSSFQDSPSSLEHFPAGSFFAPPTNLVQAGSH